MSNDKTMAELTAELTSTLWASGIAQIQVKLGDNTLGELVVRIDDSVKVRDLINSAPTLLAQRDRLRAALQNLLNLTTWCSDTDLAAARADGVAAIAESEVG